MRLSNGVFCWNMFMFDDGLYPDTFEFNTDWQLFNGDNAGPVVTMTSSWEFRLFIGRQLSRGRIHRRKVRNLWSVTSSKTTLLSRFSLPLGSNDHDEQICNLQLLQIIHKCGKSPIRNPELFGLEHLIAINSSLWIRPLVNWNFTAECCFPVMQPRKLATSEQNKDDLEPSSLILPR
jgi:hypothetical protein